MGTQYLFSNFPSRNQEGLSFPSSPLSDALTVFLAFADKLKKKYKIPQRIMSIKKSFSKKRCKGLKIPRIKSGTLYMFPF